MVKKAVEPARRIGSFFASSWYAAPNCSAIFLTCLPGIIRNLAGNFPRQSNDVANRFHFPGYPSAIPGERQTITHDYECLRRAFDKHGQAIGIMGKVSLLMFGGILASGFPAGS